MITEELRQAAADAILQAETDRKPIVQPSKTYPDLERCLSYPGALGPIARLSRRAHRRSQDWPNVSRDANGVEDDRT